MVGWEIGRKGEEDGDEVDAVEDKGRRMEQGLEGFLRIAERVGLDWVGLDWDRAMDDGRNGAVWNRSYGKATGTERHRLHKRSIRCNE